MIDDDDDDDLKGRRSPRDNVSLTILLVMITGAISNQQYTLLV